MYQREHDSKLFPLLNPIQKREWNTLAPNAVWARADSKLDEEMLKDEFGENVTINLPRSIALDGNVQQLQINLIKITNLDILQKFKDLNLALFPVTYNQNFYKNVFSIHSKLSRVAMVNDKCIGAISCREEPYLNRGIFP